MKRVSLLAICALPLSLAAHAAAPYGHGARTCAEFSAASQVVAPGKFKIRDVAALEYHSTNAAYIQWALGFVSGLRRGHTDALSKPMTGAEFDAGLRTFCAAHPAEPFANAVEDLAKREGLAHK